MRNTNESVINILLAICKKINFRGFVFGSLRASWYFRLFSAGLLHHGWQKQSMCFAAFSCKNYYEKFSGCFQYKSGSFVSYWKSYSEYMTLHFFVIPSYFFDLIIFFYWFCFRHAGWFCCLLFHCEIYFEKIKIFFIFSSSVRIHK